MNLRFQTVFIAHEITFKKAKGKSKEFLNYTKIKLLLFALYLFHLTLSLQ